MTTEPIDIAKWIEDERLHSTTDDFKLHGCTIGHCIPPKFESYCKIFHPFEVTEDEEDILEPNKDYGQLVYLTISTDNHELKITEQRNDGTVVDILERQQKRLKEYHSKKWDFVTWKSIADKYDLTFHNEINPKTYVDKFQKIGWQRNLNFPSEGYLPRKILTKLLTLLKENSSSDESYIYQKPPHNIWKDNKDCDLVKCHLHEVLEYFDNDFIGYLYSADKSWVVFTDTDLCFTLVGGHKQLIDKIISSELEVLECAATTRVDNYSDKINIKKSDNVKPNFWQKLFGQKR
ncbi:MAG: hypothetical protein SF052_07065 [Bacteroidia bacterium]|nr:hypothetical protein [Bacteroidia bacterium]